MSKKPDLSSISRRRLLGGAATIGGAAALGGTGTLAFFSDEETFANNQLVAGELDLKVDWEEHYSDWSADEADSVSDVMMPQPGGTLGADDYPDDYVGLPDPANAVVAVPSADVSAFMDATAVEAYPDADDDGSQDQTEGGDPVFPNAESICDTDSDLPTAMTSDLRTESSSGDPLIQLGDVKPGDFGELTLSFHICDNPGYVWMWGKNFEASENGYSEPEMKDPDESGDADGDGEDDEVELLDAIQTLAWYDDGDNVVEAGGEAGGQAEPTCVELVLDASGSMSGTKNTETIAGAKSLADSILNANSDNRVGVTFFSASGYSGGAANQLSVGSSDSQDLTAVQNTIDTLPANGGSTAVGAGIDTGHTDLQECPQGHRRVMVVLSNGGENVESDSAVVTRAQGYCSGSPGTDIYTIAVGSGADTQFMEDVACDPSMAFTSPDPSNIQQIFDDLTGTIQAGGEEVFFRGSLRELANELTTANTTTDGSDSGVPGFPLDGDTSTSYDEIDGNTDSPDREEFAPSNTHHIGLGWYLPVDHANEVQTDSVEFDLGFYTEQSRHNDGSGMAAGNSSS